MRPSRSRKNSAKIMMKKPMSVPKTFSATLPPIEAALLRMLCRPSVTQPCTCSAVTAVFSCTHATERPMRG